MPSEEEEARLLRAPGRGEEFSFVLVGKSDLHRGEMALVTVQRTDVRTAGVEAGAL